MAGMEVYGGRCPLCSSPMLQKWESSMSGFMFDACPSCGFIISTEMEEDTLEEMKDNWNEIFSHFRLKNRKELAEYLIKEGLKRDTDFMPSVVCITDKFLEKVKPLLSSIDDFGYIQIEKENS